MDSDKEMELLAIGIMLGSRKTATEFGPDWSFEGSNSLAAVVSELTAGECGLATKRWLAALGVGDGAGPVAVRVLAEVKRRHAERRRKRLSLEAFRFLQLGNASEADKRFKQLAEYGSCEKQKHAALDATGVGSSQSESRQGDALDATGVGSSQSESRQGDASTATGTEW